jgi:hypothetical protein
MRNSAGAVLVDLPTPCPAKIDHLRDTGPYQVLMMNRLTFVFFERQAILLVWFQIGC